MRTIGSHFTRMAAIAIVHRYNRQRRLHCILCYSATSAHDSIIVVGERVSGHEDRRSVLNSVLTYRDILGVQRVIIGFSKIPHQKRSFSHMIMVVYAGLTVYTTN